MYIIENEKIGLKQYTYDDEYDMYMCWQDIDTQKGYNFILTESFDEFKDDDITKFKFWVVIVNKKTNEKVGVIRLGLDEKCPDLAIWMYPQYRNQGYGTNAFKLALSYIFNNYDYKEISAGCYEDNIYSIKMLENIGFIRHPEGDEKETNIFTNKETTQLEYRIKK